MFGLDISHHQGTIDFNELLTNDPKVDFIFMKATQGVGFSDSKLKHNASEAAKAGIPIGYYHYATLNSTNVVQDARDEANYFVSIIMGCPKPDLPLVLDIEENKANLTKDLVEKWIHEFFITLESRGYSDYILYSYTPFLDANLSKYHSLGVVKLWIAAYVNKPKPKLPRGWDKYHIWQYSAKGKVKGISGDCDLNKTLVGIL